MLLIMRFDDGFCKNKSGSSVALKTRVIINATLFCMTDVHLGTLSQNFYKLNIDSGVEIQCCGRG